MTEPRSPHSPRRLRSGALALLAAACLAPAGTAQSGARLVGLTRVTPLVVSQHTGTCATAQCTPAGLPPPAASFPWVGGTAYDSDSRGLWVCNGLLLAKVDPRNACAAQCPVLPMPNTSPNNPVTGLAYYEPADTVYVTDQSNVIRWYTVAGGCQLSLVNRCIAPVPAGDVLTGCATDDQTGLIFYCAVTPGNPGGRVYVAQIGAPCLPICSFPVLNCGTITMGPLQGLAYDACADVLWVTDGRFTVGLSFDPIACAVLGQVQCCLNPVEPFIGLDVLANGETSTGTSCTAPTCPACPGLLHFLPSEPYIGNATFSLALGSAPGGSTAFLILNVGPCGPPVLSPPFCAGIRVPVSPPPVVAGSVTGGTPGMCNGSASIPLGIPLNPSLCGVPFCSQFLGLCGLTGHYVSNARGWTIIWS